MTRRKYITKTKVKICLALLRDIGDIVSAVNRNQEEKWLKTGTGRCAKYRTTFPELHLTPESDQAISYIPDNRKGLSDGKFIRK